MMTDNAASRRFPFFSLVLVFACASLAVLVVVLSKQNRDLKAALTAADQAMRRTQEALKPGQKLAALTGQDAAGAEFVVPLDASGPRLLLIGSTQCHACESVRPYWAELGHSAASSNMETVCLLTDGAPKADESAELSMPVLGIRAFRDSSLAKLPTVPAVLLVRNGIVEHIWPGPFDTKARDEIVSTLAAG